MRFLLLPVLLCAQCLIGGEAPPAVTLWPGPPPGETAPLPPEGNQSKPGEREVAGRPVYRTGNVSEPTLTVFKPPAERDTGAAVLVCPGGGYSILASDLEGSEVCAWLNSIGVTGVLLKYRVPVRAGRPRHAAPLQDAQRALGLVRHRAGELGLDPRRIGVLGFSAGGHLAATLSNQHGQRTYPRIDAADDESCRPDFAVLIYPAYLVDKAGPETLAPEVRPAPEQTPPTFLVMTGDDGQGVENVLGYYLALKKAAVAAELHVYAVGGHGYGLRRTDKTVTTWPDRAAEWLRASGWLAPR